MYSIEVSGDTLQSQIFELFGKNLRFELKYNTVLAGWGFDLYDLDEEKYICQNYGLAVNAPCLLEMNLDFIVIMLDNSGLGINGVASSEMGRRLSVYFMSKEDFYNAIRSKI